MAKNKQRQGKSVGYIVATILKYVSLVFFSLCAIVPIVSCVITAFKTDTEYNTTNVMELPGSWLNFDNFVNAFKQANMLLALFFSFISVFNFSIIVLFFVLLGSILIGTQLAYVLNRFKFPGNGFIRNLFTFAALLPGVAMQVAVYEIMLQLNLVNTLYGYIILMMGTDVISIYIFIQYFENLSPSLDESAIIDGASYFTIYRKILLPLLKPAIVTAVRVNIKVNTDEITTALKVLFSII